MINYIWKYPNFGVAELNYELYLYTFRKKHETRVET